MKKLTIFLFVCIYSAVNAQTNCKLLSQATLTVDTSSTTNSTIIMAYLSSGVGITAPIIDSTQWQYIAFTKHADGTGETYVNGNLVYTGAFTPNGYSYSSLYLGASYYTSWTKYYKGWIDELRVSNIVRSATDIQNHYNSSNPFSADGNTIGLWHFDETSGTSIANEVSGSGTLSNGPTFGGGKFSNALYFDGINDRGDCNLNIPEDDITIEFWIKLDGANAEGTIVQPYGTFSSDIRTREQTRTPQITWSTGDTTESITIDPKVDSIVWVNNGVCTDTINFYGASTVTNITVTDTTHITINDTITTNVTVTDTTHITVNDTISTTNNVTVTDTLVINAVLTGIAAPNNTNTVKVYPNPAKTHITIDNGDYVTMNGYSIEIKNSLGQTVFTSIVNQQLFEIDLSSWSGNGLYFLHIIDSGSNTIEVKKIIIE